MDERLGRLAHRFVRVPALSAQERERLATHALALLFVAAIASVRSVIGLTGQSVPFTFYAIAVLAAAARGGLASALVAMLASMVVAAIDSRTTIDASARMLFAAESLGLTAVMSVVSARARRTRKRLESAQITIGRLQTRDQRGRLLDAALRHVEDTAVDSAIVVMNPA